MPNELPRVESHWAPIIAVSSTLSTAAATTRAVFSAAFTIFLTGLVVPSPCCHHRSPPESSLSCSEIRLAYRTFAVRIAMPSPDTGAETVQLDDRDYCEDVFAPHAGNLNRSVFIIRFLNVDVRSSLS